MKLVRLKETGVSARLDSKSESSSPADDGARAENELDLSSHLNETRNGCG